MRNLNYLKAIEFEYKWIAVLYYHRLELSFTLECFFIPPWIQLGRISNGFIFIQYTVIYINKCIKQTNKQQELSTLAGVI